MEGLELSEEQKQRMSDVYLINIIMKQKNEYIDKQKIEDEINKLLANFSKKYGRKVNNIKITDIKNNQYKITVEVK